MSIWITCSTKTILALTLTQRDDGKFFEETFVEGINFQYHAALEETTTIDYYFAFMNWDIFDIIVDQTNIYTPQMFLEN